MSTYLPVLDAVPPSPARPPAANCSFGGGCGEAARPARPLPIDVAEKVRNHPCYSQEAHHHFARMHLAVAPACNLQCHYCNRKFDCASESRPGVVSERLTPDQAIRKVLAVAAEVKQLSVVGIAGPGDPLANPAATFATLEGLRKVAPDLTLCLSTNGLALPDHVERLAALGVNHVTVTVNMVDPAVGEAIYPWALWREKKVRGRDAARMLSERQLEGIELLTARGILCKVNSVVIPGVNDQHLPEVSRRLRQLGVFLQNVMPLLSAPEHGTHYGLVGQPGPTAAQLEAVQRACEVDSRIMRHCRQCRSDAVGLLGEDRSAEFTVAAMPPEPAQDAREVRAAHRLAVERVRERQEAARREALQEVAAVRRGLTARVAVATRGDGLVNQHFGHAREFLVYDVDRSGARLVAPRAVERYCRGGEGEEDTLKAVLRALSDCQAVLVAMIGHCPRGQLAAAGIEPVMEFAHQPIDAAVLGWFAGFAARVAGGERPAVRALAEPEEPVAAVA